MKIYSKSDIGLKRKENQDNYKYNVISPSCLWAIVCDGMGGMNGGYIASLTAVEVISDYLSKYFTDQTNEKDIPAILISALEKANDEIYVQGSTKELFGMGTTCDVVIIKDDRLFCVHVGDSRTHIIRNDKVIQITEDHSMVQEMVKRGEITQEQAKNHPNKNFITRALGVNAQVYIDSIESDLKDDDVILMCSDGLSNYVDNDQFVEVLKNEKMEDVTDKLVSLAIEKGGSDNITVTVIFKEGHNNG